MSKKITGGELLPLLHPVPDGRSHVFKGPVPHYEETGNDHVGEFPGHCVVFTVEMELAFMLTLTEMRS